MFNEVAKVIRATYFPTENHGTTENPKYWKATRTMELYNNGVIGFDRMVRILSICCGCSENDILDTLKGTI